MRIMIKQMQEIELEVSLNQDQVVELRHGDKEIWGVGYIVSIFDMFDDTYALVRVEGHADHPYLVNKIKCDNGTLYWYEGEC